jgi:hypothetical protein
MPGWDGEALLASAVGGAPMGCRDPQNYVLDT